MNEIDLRQLFGILLAKIWLIIILTLLGGGAAYAMTHYFIEPQYTATVSMYVYNDSDRLDELITSSDITTSQKLVATYIVILTSNSVLDDVSEELDHQYTASQLRGMIQAASINNTEAFEVDVTYTDPKVAQKIANTIAKVAPEQIIRVVKAGAVEVIDYATLPTSPSKPNTQLNIIIGALLGCVLAVLLVVIRAMLDTTVRSEEDLKAAFTIPVLGVIPQMNEKNDGGGI